MPDWIQRTDEGLRAQSLSFSERLSAEPEVFGVPPQRAAELALKQQEYTVKLRLATEPGTDSTTAIVAKRTARESLVEDMRSVAKLVRATRGVPAAKVAMLGMKVPAPRRRRVRGPMTAPQVFIASADRRTLTVTLLDPESPSRRARPRDVSCAAVFGFAGDNPPAHVSQWKPLLHPTRTTFTVEFNDPEVASGATVWVTAAWLGTRLHPGPMGVPACTRVYGPPVVKLNVLRRAAA